MPLAIYVLGLGIFSMATSEVMVTGLMPLLASDFHVSVGAVGFLVSAYALAMTIGGPLLTVGLLKVSRKTALLMIFAGFVLAQSFAAISTDYVVMLVARVVTGAASSAFFGVALALCVEIVGPSQRGRASSIVLGGLMVGTVLGLPGATLIGQSFGWRVSFWVVAALALIAGLITMSTVPATPRPEGVRLQEELTAFRAGKLWAVFATSLLVIGATFAAFSYFAPILTEVSGFGLATVPWLLVVYGAATVIGNNIVGRLADRYTILILAIGLLSLIAVLTIFALFAQYRLVAIAALIVLGLVGVTMNPAMVTRVMRTSNDRPLVNTVHTAVITLGIVVGSWAGGLAIDVGYGLRSPLWIGAVLAVIGFLTLLPDLRRRTTTTREPVEIAS